MSLAPDFERAAAWARRRGTEVQIGPEGSPVPKGFETAHLSDLPGAARLKAPLARFPIELQERAFVFDGRTYSGEDVAIVLADPGNPREVFVIGIASEPAAALAVRRLFRRKRTRPTTRWSPGS